MTHDEIEERFPTAASAPKPSPEQVIRSNQLKSSCLAFAHELNMLTPDGRWKSLALTALETVLMWANKAIFNEKATGDE